MNPVNSERAEWAENALQTFIDETWSGEAEPEDMPDVVCDLVTDLMHYCDQNGIAWGEVLDRATNHYEDEVAEVFAA